MQDAGVSNVTIHPGQSLLLRCRITTYRDPYPEWDHDGVKVNDINLACCSDSQEVSLLSTTHTTECSRNYSHSNHVFFNSSSLKKTTIVKVR